MTGTATLEITPLTIPLDSAGSLLLSQQIGYFHCWRFTRGDGSVDLEGEVRASFGGQTNAERIPFTYNSKIALAVPVDRVLVEWDAQPNRIALIYMTRDPRLVEAQNIPAKQLVFQGQATRHLVSNLTVGTGAVNVALNEPDRLRVIIQAASTNTAAVTIANNSAQAPNGLILDPGASFVGFSSAAYTAISTVAGQNVRVMRELA